MTDADIQRLLRTGMTVCATDYVPPLVFTPEEPEKPETRYDRYMQFIDSIAPSFNDFGDGWGGDDTPRQMAMKLYPYDEWDGH